MCHTVETAMPPDAHVASRIRVLLRAELGEHLAWAQDEPAIEDAQLIASELVANAVQSGTRSVGFELTVHHKAVIVAVTDDAAGWPTPQPPSMTAEHGRGLRLVNALADRWDAEHVGVGHKRVWARLIVPEGLTDSIDCRLRH